MLGVHQVCRGDVRGGLFFINLFLQLTDLSVVGVVRLSRTSRRTACDSSCQSLSRANHLGRWIAYIGRQPFKTSQWDGKEPLLTQGAPVSNNS